MLFRQRKRTHERLRQSAGKAREQERESQPPKRSKWPLASNSAAKNKQSKDLKYTFAAARG